VELTTVDGEEDDPRFSFLFNIYILFSYKLVATSDLTMAPTCQKTGYAAM
jgi:hypothetical protein